MKTFKSLARISLILTLCVIIMGAYVRLSDAGLGCPDWPGCYGNLFVPEVAEHIGDEFRHEETGDLHRQLEPHKAWKEMIHRYMASTLGLLIVAMAVLAWRNRKDPDQPIIGPIFLVALVIFQGLLGMWTVTLFVAPLIVSAHLMGGMATLVMLTWIVVSTSDKSRFSESTNRNRFLLPLSFIGFFVLTTQIFLGGWTSTNYAALICPDFPTCQGHWWPAMDFKEGFTMHRELGTVDYEFGILKADARTAIHMTHRIGAMVTFFTLALLALMAFRNNNESIRKAAWMVSIFLILQVSLGIGNIAMGLPLGIAVAHNGVAALLLMSVTILLFRVYRAKKI